MLMGISIGLLAGLTINFWTTHLYKNVLVMKAENKTAENIHGEFYYIVHEKDFRH